MIRMSTFICISMGWGDAPRGLGVNAVVMMQYVICSGCITSMIMSKRIC